MKRRPRSNRHLLWWVALPIAIGALAAARWIWSDGDQRAMGADRGPTAVVVVPIEKGVIEETRVFTGSLEPSARVVMTAEVAGVVRSVEVDLAAVVEPEQLLATIDDREYRQREMAARAELSVARARASAAQSAVTIAERALQRARTLNQRGIASERELDEATATATERRGAAEVAEAEVARARATLSAARLELARTQVRGVWAADAGARRVATRHVDEGARVGVGDPLFTLVDVDPLVIAVTVSASDYARLAPGQVVTLQAGGSYEGRVVRIAPAFDPGTRQARVEIEVDNADGVLQPGMFVRARTILAREDSATLLPVEALAKRSGTDVVFVLDEGADSVRMVEVETGLRTDAVVEVRTAGLEGKRVVTLGHQRLSDGAAVRVTDRESGATP